MSEPRSEEMNKIVAANIAHAIDVLKSAESELKAVLARQTLGQASEDELREAVRAVEIARARGQEWKP